MKIESIRLLLIIAALALLLFIALQNISYANFNFDKPSPKDRIKERQIVVLEDRIIIFLKNASLSRYAATKSMDPVIDVNANGIEIKPKTEKDIAVGDIIAFERNNKLIVHRVIEIGYDNEGWYCITKGDNALFDDGKIRFDEIKYITVGILY